jgi:hypothetical protein
MMIAMKFICLNLFTLIFLSSCSSPRIQHSQIKTNYLRSDWHHWIDENRDCLNTRAEILKKRSQVAVTMNKSGCSIKSGKWQDYYYPEILTYAKQVDIDHLIPLKHAHENGGSGWSSTHKEEFANDPENLVITNKTYNRQKGAKGIDEWLPRHKGYACKYIYDWMKIKNKYGLEIRKEELETFQLLKNDCSSF